MSLYVDIKKKLSGFTLNIKFEGSKETIGLLGASGSGKSITLRCIAGLIKPDEGRIVINDRVVFDSKEKINLKPKDRKVGFFFQNYALFPHLTVYENIAFGLSGLSKNDIKVKVEELLEKFHLKGLEQRYPSQISGGQQQRVALARVIAPEPDVLLLDEPFSALDNHLRSHMVKEMEESLKYYEKSTIFVTHNMDEAYRLSDNLVVLHQGEIQGFGPKEYIFENPPTIEAARITGWKNIFEAIKIDDEHIEISSPKIRLKTKSKVKSDKGYVCIRSNYIRLSNEDNDNVFPVWIVGGFEDPFNKTLYLSMNKNNVSEEYLFHWEINKDEWENIKNMDEPLKACFPKDKIVFIPK
jgi:ABC-type sulfate/molybdate transport systems ATPase subunit